MAVNGIDGPGPCGSHGSFRLEQPPFFERYIETCAAHLAETIGSDEIEEIVLCGSFALGEGGISFDSVPALLLSDIDILVVVRKYETLRRLLPVRAELGASCESLTDDLCFAGRVDVGIMMPVDLERMPPRPGVFDLKTHGRTLFGSGRVLDHIPGYAPEQVGGHEAVLLLENRIVSLLGCFGNRAGEGDTFPYGFLYEIARVYTDIATALLCVSRLYTPGYEKRSGLLREAVRDGRLALPVTDDLAALVDSWTEYKLRPSCSHLEQAPDPDYLAALWDGASRNILSCWSACESFLQGREQEGASVPRLLEERVSSGGMRTNLRAWRSYLGERPVGRGFIELLGAGAQILRTDPTSLVRASALELMNRYVERGSEGGVEGVNRFPGHDWNTWEEAAHDLFELWRGMVFGRRGD